MKTDVVKREAGELREIHAECVNLALLALREMEEPRCIKGSGGTPDTGYTTRTGGKGSHIDVAR